MSNTKNEGLIKACIAGNLEEIIKLLTPDNQGHVANINYETNKELTPLMVLTKHGHLDIIKYLLSHNYGVKRYPVEEHKKTILPLAVEYNHINIIKYLCDYRTKEEDEEYFLSREIIASLYTAAAEDKIEIFQYLLEKQQVFDDFNINEQDVYEETLLDTACYHHSFAVAEYLLKQSPFKEEIMIQKTFRTGYNLFLGVSKMGGINLMNLLLSCNKIVDKLPYLCKDYSDKTALMYACDAPDLSIMKLLLSSPKTNTLLSVKDKTIYGETILMYACKSNQLELIKYLLTSPDLKEHADINELDNEKKDIFAYINCSSDDYVDLLNYFLLEKKLSPNIATIEYLKKIKNFEIINIIEKYKVFDSLNEKLINNISSKKQKI